MTAVAANNQGGLENQTFLKFWPDLIFHLGSEGTILETSTNDSPDFLINRASLVGKRIQRVPDKDVAYRFERALARMEKSRSLVTMEYDLIFPQGKRSFEARLVPIDRGEILVVIRNASDQKRHESITMQNEKMSMIGRLAGGIAHEINNPLGIILGFSQSLQSEADLTSPFKTALSFIEKETLRCKTLIQNLLSFSRPSSGQEETVDAQETISEALSLALAQARIKDVDLTTEFEDALPPIRVNRNEIQQMVLKLCSNAIEAMPKGGRLTVAMGRAEREGRKWLYLRVTDTRAGIAGEIRSKFLEPFFIAREIDAGSGFGLEFVHDIVKKHQGQIEVSSGAGKGAAFTVFLPLS